jgi:hypothetical protein
MRNYILSHSIEMNDRLFFVIFDDFGKPLGHLGLSNVQGDSADVDNVMRAPNISNFSMRDVLSFILDWSNIELGIQNFGLTVMPDNRRALELYSALGFKSLPYESTDDFLEHETSFANPEELVPIRMFRRVDPRV